MTIDICGTRTKTFLTLPAVLLSALLALLALAPDPVKAQTLNIFPATWRTGALSGFPTCQAALDTSLDRARAFSNDPLNLINGSSCENAVLISPGPPPDYRLDWRLTTSLPTTPNHDSIMTPECPPGSSGLFNSSHGWHCTGGDVTRNLGTCPDGNCPVGNPINAGFGNKFQRETDYAGAGPFPLRLERMHNSARGLALADRSGFWPPETSTGSNWTHNYARRLSASGPTQGNNPLAPVASYNSAAVNRPDGKLYAFNLVGGVWTPDVGLMGERLEKLSDGWKLTTSEDEVETYDLQGRLVSISNRAGLTQTLAYIQGGLNSGLLQSVTDPFGRTLTFNYQDGRLVSVTIPGGGQIAYGYSNDQHRQLQTVTYPDNGTRTYHYENPVSYKRMLTGITDELGVRFATWGYDTNINSPTQGRATLSERAGGAGRVTISYFDPSGIHSTPTVTTYVTPAVSAARTYSFERRFGVMTLSGITGPACPSCGDAVSGYNGATGLLTSGTDWNGNSWSRGLDTSRNLFTTLNLALAGPAVTPDSLRTVYTWHPVFRLQTKISGPLRDTTHTYDPDGSACGARGALCSTSVQATTNTAGFDTVVPVGAPRVWTYTYNANGQVLTANGPRTDVADVTTYTYDAQGNVASVTNAAGHTTQIPSYNVHGQPLTIIDPNGLTTTLTYDARQRLTSRSVGGETTAYDYDLAGQLVKVTMPDGSFLAYGYDGAHRLTSITDNLGNKIQYTLDLAGNRTKEEVFDPSSALAQTRSRVYSNINRLFQELGALGQTTEYTYDNQGNVLTVKDPLNRTTTNTYTRRHQLQQVTDPASGVTQYGMNGLSALASVTDPRNLTTTYALDGLGNMNAQVSPDTGTTANTYDLAGNLATQTDAKGQVTTYAYDALNWDSPGSTDSFDRCDDDIGGVRWDEGYSARSSSARR